MIGNLLEVENYNLINPNLKIDKIYCWITVKSNVKDDFKKYKENYYSR